MRTPKFSISQDDEFVHVTVKVPHIRVSAAELVTDGCTFTFYCRPYLLKLNFPYPFKEEDEECKATYDPFDENGTLVAHLPKLETGQYYPDLDLTSKLLITRTDHITDNNPKTPNIEVLQSEDIDLPDELDADVLSTEDLPQTWLTIQDVMYGFNNQYSHVFDHLREELLDMLEIRHPESIRAPYRTVLRISSENSQFNAQRYLADFHDGESDPIYTEAMAFKPFYILQWDTRKSKKVKKSEGDVAAGAGAGTGTGAGAGDCSPVVAPHPRDQAFEEVGGFSEAEREIMASKLPRKEYLIPSESDREFALLLTLVDVLFAHCYDHRLTTGEGNVESAHTVARLSCTLSWLEDYLILLQHLQKELGTGVAAKQESVRRCILFSLRRSLIFPYLRMWKLARKVLADVAKLLFLGKRALLKCLLQIYALFEHTDTHYLLNKVYIADLCLWLQRDTLREDTLTAFAKMYNAAKKGIEKSPHEGRGLVGFHLPELEQWAMSTQELEEVEEGEEQSDSGSQSDSEGSEDSESSDDDSSDTASHSGGEEGAESSDDDDEGPQSEGNDYPAQHAETISMTDDACPIPAALLDYATLQAQDPHLLYLRMDFPTSLLGAADTEEQSKVFGEGTIDAAESAISKMLALPKRKADSVLDGSQGVAGREKKPLIEDITPSATAVDAQQTSTSATTAAEEVGTIEASIANLSITSTKD